MANHIRTLTSTSNVFNTAVTDINNQLDALILANKPGTINPIDVCGTLTQKSDGTLLQITIAVSVQYVG